MPKYMKAAGGHAFEFPFSHRIECKSITYDDRMDGVKFLNCLLPLSSCCNMLTCGVMRILKLIKMPVHHDVEVSRLTKIFVPRRILLIKREKERDKERETERVRVRMRESERDRENERQK